MTQVSPLERAIAIVGSQTALASAIGGNVKTGHIFYWLKSGSVPAEHCPAIERATQGRVRCEELNSAPAWDVLRLQSTPAETEA